MLGISRYTAIGLSVLFIAGMFVFFSNEDNIEYEISGIVSDVRISPNGYTFIIVTAAGDEIKCFSYEEPVYLGHYAISGEFSQDGNIFFVSVLRNLDIEKR